MNDDVTGLVNDGQTREPHPAHRRANDIPVHTALCHLPGTLPGNHREQQEAEQIFIVFLRCVTQCAGCSDVRCQG